MQKNKEIIVTFPDGNTKNFTKGISGKEVAESISISLSKRAIAIEINGAQKDLVDPINIDCSISIITVDSSEGLEIMRHTLAAQVLARAVKSIYPNAKLAIGPTIDNGFYYDVLFEKPISVDDLPILENEMRKIISKGSMIKKTFHSKSDAISFFKKRNEDYKIEIIKNSGQSNNFQIYKQEDSDFIDLCYGPHLPNLKHIGSFKLIKLAGAYWKGDSNKEMLQRIYGTAWKNEKDLNHYLSMIEEAEKRDHRKLGKELDLFHLQEQAVGSVFWHPKGWLLYRIIMEYMRKKLEQGGYKEVNTPQLVDSSLWKDSGHWDKFREQMFVSESEEKILAIKPMNCPCHVQIFRQGIKSYKELPIRMAEFGSCHRNEPSGALHGLMRVRAFTQDDAHIFCSEDQINNESVSFCELLTSIYNDFGFENITIKFSDRPEIRAGDDKTWDQAEKALMDASDVAGLDVIMNPGEGAFYGPKLEFVLRDAIGRDWQCGTLQVDFVLPERLKAEYIATDGSKRRPVMLHRAILGSMERWFGILIEQYAGKWPLWLAPNQIVICTITQDADKYSDEIKMRAEKSGLRVLVDKRNEKIGYKIREHSENKVPILFIIGNKEIEKKEVSIRRLGSKDQKNIDLEEALTIIELEALPPDLARMKKT